ncbi:hypothetical protein [Rhodobacter sp. 24-YEA-8]|uniref:hypothetical protein n=1 Tax=Rhodobacter sp. 24-YEA-8 TaxID=1884310 RepID=UPI000895EB87|nr:hypothetical protein [Rhodobacter sp. 24-YEA-8]SEB80329.1 hypothetical protein SAMN05519105_1341 [Rhodobacter sp. 24-YEA-8]
MHNIIVRMVIYILSPILTAAVALISGWGVSYDATSHVLSLDLPALIGAVMAAVGLSGAVFARWGVR